MNNGKFIVIEGLDYSGKSTLAPMLVSYLNSIGIDAIHASSSNQDNRLARVIKEHVLTSTNLPSVDTQAMLYAACINDLVDTVLLPAVSSGKWVVCERYTLSNKIYQTHSLITSSLTGSIERQLSPDLTIVLDITPQVYSERAQLRGGHDTLERAGDDVITQRRKQYRLHARQNENIVLLDSTMTPNELLKASIGLLNDTLL